MSENFDVNGVKTTSQTFSNKGVSLKNLKDQNSLLFDFFKKKGYKEDAVIYSTDVDNIFKEADSNNNGKLSIKEARTLFGMEDSKRSEVRASIKEFNNIKSMDLPENEKAFPVKVNENETDFYNKDKVLLSNTKILDNNNKLETTYINGTKELVDKTVETSADGKKVVTTEYLNGNPKFPQKVLTEENGDTAIVVNTWQDGNLTVKKTTNGDNIEIKKFKPGVDTPEEIIQKSKTDSDSKIRKVNQFDKNNNIVGQTIEYSGAKIGENLIKEDIVLDPETGNRVSEEATFSDGTKQYYKNFNGKLEQVGQDKDGNSFVVLDVPEGWSMPKIAEKFGISEEDLLKANTAEDGKAKYRTNKKGVNYFLVDQKAVIPKPTKMPVDEGLSFSYEIHEKESAVEDEANQTAHTPTESSTQREGAPRGKSVETHTSTDKTTPHNSTQGSKKQTPAKIPTSRSVANQPASVRQRIAAAKSVPYQYLPSKAHGMQASLASNDPRITLNKSRNNKGYIEQRLSGFNIKNTMCGFAKLGNTTLPSKLLRAYSKTDKKYPNGETYKYDYKTLIGDLQFVKSKITEAKKLGYKIPPALYAYIPPKDGNPKRIAMEVKAYEAVFGKGSANYKV